MGNTINLNPISLGIEMVNRNDGADWYETAQLTSAAKQVADGRHACQH